MTSLAGGNNYDSINNVEEPMAKEKMRFGMPRVIINTIAVVVMAAFFGGMVLVKFLIDLGLISN